jgi:aspartate oxidase
MPRSCSRRTVQYLIVAVGLAPTPAASQVADSAAAVRSVLTTEDARFSAMIRADTAALRGALSNDLSYVHSSAHIETKAQYLESIGSHSLRYEVFTPRERRVRMLGPAAAMVVGLAHARAESGGQVMDADVRYLAVYESVRARWRLVAWQTTRVPAK